MSLESKQNELDSLKLRNIELLDILKTLQIIDHARKNNVTISYNTSNEYKNIIMESFKYYDTNNDQLLNSNDFQNVLSDLKEILNNYDLLSQWAIINPSNKEFINSDDFITYISKQNNMSLITGELNKSKLNYSTRTAFKEMSEKSSDYLNKLAKLNDSSISTKTAAITIGNIESTGMKMSSKLTFPTNEKVNEIFTTYGISSDIINDYSIGYFGEFNSLETVNDELKNEVVEAVKYVNESFQQLKMVIVPSFEGKTVRIAAFVNVLLQNNELTNAVFETYRNMEILPCVFDFKYPFEHYTNSDAPLMDFTNFQVRSNVEYNRGLVSSLAAVNPFLGLLGMSAGLEYSIKIGNVHKSFEKVCAAILNSDSMINPNSIVSDDINDYVSMYASQYPPEHEIFGKVVAVSLSPATKVFKGVEKSAMKTLPAGFVSIFKKLKSVQNIRAVTRLGTDILCSFENFNAFDMFRTSD